MSQTEIVVKQASFLDLNRTDMIQQASEIANQLSEIIENQKLYESISGRKYIKVEGWSTLGTLVGVMPYEREVKQIKGGWEAHVELRRIGDHTAIACGSAICTRSERTWAKRDEYAVRSMAITRATGKAYRLSLGWIATLKGYAVTPAEEMPVQEVKPVQQMPAKTAQPKQKPIAKFDKTNEGHAKRLLDKFPDLVLVSQDEEDRVMKELHGQTVDMIDVIMNGLGY